MRGEVGDFSEVMQSVRAVFEGCRSERQGCRVDLGGEDSPKRLEFLPEERDRELTIRICDSNRDVLFAGKLTGVQGASVDGDGRWVRIRFRPTDEMEALVTSSGRILLFPEEDEHRPPRR